MVSAANEKLRAARERTASPDTPDECLSRQGLAELVNAWAWKHHHKMVAASANYIGQLERGKIRWPGKLYREALRAIFNVSTDAALGFVNSRRAVVKLADVNRKKFIKTTLGGVGALVLEGSIATLLESLLEDNSEPTPIPRRIGMTEIEQVRTATQVFASWSRNYGGGLAREAVRGQLRWSAGLLDADCPARLRPELFSAVGYLANVGGFMAVDANAHREADRVYRFALACTEQEQAEDWHLRAEILSSMAKQAIWTGQPDKALTLAGHGLVRPDRLTAIERSLLHTDQARALAKMRRAGETLAAVGTADDHFAHATPADESPYVAYYSDARHAQLTGQALFDLALQGGCNPGRVANLLDTAAARQPSYPGSRAICLAKLATLTMVTGDPLQGAAIGHTAVDLAGAIRSRRATEELRELSRHATAHQRLDEVAHLRHRIGSLLRRTDNS
ncbi:MAG: XRE family transcriptional regulator [Pseudonocardiales bacterium]|nr:XRE family transcriptional regulator [Pseudonocardiales bacterium]